MRLRITFCRALAATLCLSFLPAAAGDDGNRPSATVPDTWGDSVDGLESGVSAEWWRTFGDPLLDSLVAVGEKNNYSVAAAARRIDIARAAVGQSRAGLFPQIGVSGGWTQQRQAGDIVSPSVPASTRSWWNGGVTLSWEIDVFGKVRRQMNESRKQVEVTAAEYKGVMLSLQAEIVSTYITLLVDRAQLEVANEHSENQKRILEITETRYRTGLVSKLDVAQARTLYYSTTASIPLLESSIEAQYNALGVLTGVGREGLPETLFEPRPIPDGYSVAAVGTPAEVLRRRPDVIAAERNIEVAAAQLGVARSAWLPSLSVSASAGTSAHSLDDLFSDRSFTYSIAPTLSWTLFDGLGRKYADAQARQNMEAMIDNYNLTVLTAVEEVRNAIAAYKATHKYIERLRTVVTNSKEAVDLSLARYTQGLTDFYNVVEAQLNYLTYQNSLVAARGRALISLTDLYKVLGGGIN